MPKRKDIKNILVIGAGPIIIGQACEFDYSGTQACKALKDEGFKVILVNSNPATIMTDPGVAHKTYIEPITIEVLEEILKKEKPDAILPTMGGQTALNLAIKAEKIGLLKKYNISFIVLARYMQIISSKLIKEYTNSIINIHHSFLPAFPGAKPYHSAFERGVKIIGATSHYVTDELDGGPIIEQDVSHVSHSHSIDHLLSIGRDLEKIVLSRAVKNHINHKVMVYKNKTIIFSWYKKLNAKIKHQSTI